jgi:hypothetical protein
MAGCRLAACTKLQLRVSEVVGAMTFPASALRRFDLIFD